MTSSLNLIDGIEPNLAESIPRWLEFKIVQMMELIPRGAEGWGPETLYLLITNERTNLMMVG